MVKETRILNEDLGAIRGTVSNENEKYARRLTVLVRPDGRLMIYNLNTGHSPTGVEEEVALEADGSQREQVVLWDYTGAVQIRAAGEPATGQAMVSLYGTNVSGNLTAIENEDTGELRTMLMGWDGAAPIRVLTEATGEPRVALVGTDEAGNLDNLRTDPNRIPWKRDYPAYEQVDPVEIPAVDGILWNPGAAAAELYEVSFLVVNNDAGAANVTVSVGVDLTGAGALAAPEYWMFNEIITYPGNSEWRGPFIIAGDDDVRGIASAANDASIHWRIRRVDVGA